MASKSLVLKGSTVDNIYFLDLNNVLGYDTKCLVIKNEDLWLWQKLLGHYTLT